MGILLLLGWAILAIIIMIGAWFVLTSLVHAQEVPPAVPPTTPTVTNVPTPTTPNPNFQYLPQKAYVQPFAPEVGIPSNAIPLTSVPQVIPMQPVQQQVGGFDFGTIMGVISAITAGGALLKSKLVGDKTNKVEATSQNNAEQIVKGAAVDQSIAKTMFELAPKEKVDAMEGTAPDIKLVKLAQNKDEAVTNAAKA